MKTKTTQLTWFGLTLLTLGTVALAGCPAVESDADAPTYGAADFARLSYAYGSWDTCNSSYTVELHGDGAIHFAATYPDPLPSADDKAPACLKKEFTTTVAAEQLTLDPSEIIKAVAGQVEELTVSGKKEGGCVDAGGRLAVVDGGETTEVALPTCAPLAGAAGTLETLVEKLLFAPERVDVVIYSEVWWNDTSNCSSALQVSVSADGSVTRLITGSNSDGTCGTTETKASLSEEQTAALFAKVLDDYAATYDESEFVEVMDAEVAIRVVARPLTLVDTKNLLGLREQMQASQDALKSLAAD